MTIPDFWRLIAGLGMFLYGMYHLEDTLKNAEGRAFKLFLQRHTKTKLSAIFSGTLATAILQSSSIVNLMVLSFVGAGMLTMRNALGVALGANVGGTFNSWLVAMLGFKADIGALTLPLIGLSGIGLILFRNKGKLYHLSRFCMGFGLLFLGLDFMKESMDAMIEKFDFTPYLGYHRIVFVLIGFIITALIQTSAATVVIVLSALYAHIIPIETAVAVVLGAELGTTMKVMLGSIGGIAAKKRVAYGNIIFNVTTSLFGFLLLTPIVVFIRDIIGFNDPIIILVAFQSLINIVGVFIFYFFLNYLGDYLERHFSDDDLQATYFLKNTSPEISDTAMEMLEKEVGLFIYRVVRLNREVFRIPELEKSKDGFAVLLEKNDISTAAATYKAKYELIKKAEGEIVSFYSKMALEPMDGSRIPRLNQLMVSIRNAMYSAKGIKDVNEDRESFSNSLNDLKFDSYKLFQKELAHFYSGISRLLTLEDRSACYDELTRLMQSIKDEYDERMKTSYKYAGKEVLKEEELSTLFNFNRELYSSAKAIVFSLKDYLLDAEMAARFDSEPLALVK